MAAIYSSKKLQARMVDYHNVVDRSINKGKITTSEHCRESEMCTVSIHTAVASIPGTR